LNDLNEKGMINANELRIGNFIMYSDIKKVFDVGLWFFRELDAGISDINDFEPIQLTEEWLLKFGFTKSESNDYYQFYDLDCFRVFLGIKVVQSIFISWKDCQIESSINNLSVHSLQNLYFALTGQELHP